MCLLTSMSLCNLTDRNRYCLRSFRFASSLTQLALWIIAVAVCNHAAAHSVNHTTAQAMKAWLRVLRRLPVIAAAMLKHNEGTAKQ